MFGFTPLLQKQRYTISTTSKDEVFAELAALRRLDSRARILRKVVGALLALLIAAIVIAMPNGGVYAALGYYPGYLEPELGGGIPFGNVLAVVALVFLYRFAGRLKTVHPHPDGDAIMSAAALLAGLSLQEGSQIRLSLDLRNLDGGEFKWLELDAISTTGFRIRVDRTRVLHKTETSRQRVSSRAVRVTYAVTDFWADTLTISGTPDQHRALGVGAVDASSAKDLPLPAGAKVIGFSNDLQRLALGLQSKHAASVSEVGGLLTSLAALLGSAPIYQGGADGTIAVPPAPSLDGALLGFPLAFIGAWFGSGIVMAMQWNLAVFVPALYDTTTDPSLLCPASIVLSGLAAGALIAMGRKGA